MLCLVEAVSRHESVGLHVCFEATQHTFKCWPIHPLSTFAVGHRLLKTAAICKPNIALVQFFPPWAIVNNQRRQYVSRLVWLDFVEVLCENENVEVRTYSFRPHQIVSVSPVCPVGQPRPQLPQSRLDREHL